MFSWRETSEFPVFESQQCGIQYWTVRTVGPLGLRTTLRTLEGRLILRWHHALKCKHKNEWIYAHHDVLSDFEHMDLEWTEWVVQEAIMEVVEVC